VQFERTPLIGNEMRRDRTPMVIAAEKTEQIATFTTNLENLTRCIKTDRDNLKLRSEIRVVRSEITNLIREVADLLRQDTDEKFLKKEVLKNFQPIVSNARRCMALSVQLEKENPLTTRQEVGEDGSMTQIAVVSFPEFNDKLREISEHELDNKIIKERNQEVKELTEDVISMKPIFQDFAVLINEQGEMLNMTERNAEKAEIAAKIAVQDLKTGQKRALAARCKICVVITIIIIVVIVIALIIAGVVGLMSSM